MSSFFVNGQGEVSSTTGLNPCAGSSHRYERAGGTTIANPQWRWEIYGAYSVTLHGSFNPGVAINSDLCDNITYHDGTITFNNLDPDQLYEFAEGANLPDGISGISYVHCDTGDDDEDGYDIYTDEPKNYIEYLEDRIDITWGNVSYVSATLISENSLGLIQQPDPFINNDLCNVIAEDITGVVEIPCGNSADYTFSNASDLNANDYSNIQWNISNGWTANVNVADPEIITITPNGINSSATLTATITPLSGAPYTRTKNLTTPVLSATAPNRVNCSNGTFQVDILGGDLGDVDKILINNVEVTNVNDILDFSCTNNPGGICLDHFLVQKDGSNNYEVQVIFGSCTTVVNVDVAVGNINSLVRTDGSGPICSNDILTFEARSSWISGSHFDWDYPAGIIEVSNNTTIDNNGTPLDIFDDEYVSTITLDLNGITQQAFKVAVRKFEPGCGGIYGNLEGYDVFIDNLPLPITDIHMEGVICPNQTAVVSVDHSLSIDEYFWDIYIYGAPNLIDFSTGNTPYLDLTPYIGNATGATVHVVGSNHCGETPNYSEDFGGFAPPPQPSSLITGGTVNGKYRGGTDNTFTIAPTQPGLEYRWTFIPYALKNFQQPFFPLPDPEVGFEMYEFTPDFGIRSNGQNVSCSDGGVKFGEVKSYELIVEARAQCGNWVQLNNNNAKVNNNVKYGCGNNGNGNNNAFSINLNPNPSHNNVNVVFNGNGNSSKNIRIIDSYGIEKKNINTINTVENINISDFQIGVYSVIATENNNVDVKHLQVTP